MEKGCGIALSPAAPVSGGVPALSDGSDPQTPASGMTAAARASSSESPTSFAARAAEGGVFDHLLRDEDLRELDDRQRHHKLKRKDDGVFHQRLAAVAAETATSENCKLQNGKSKMLTSSHRSRLALS